MPRKSFRVTWDAICNNWHSLHCRKSPRRPTTREEKIRESIRGSFDTDPDRTKVEELLSSIPKGADDTLDGHKEMINMTEAIATVLASDDGTNTDAPQPEQGEETGEINQIPADSSSATAGSHEDCLAIFKRLIADEQPGLTSYYADRNALNAKAISGAAMIARLVKSGCTMENARELVILILYNIVILIGTCLSLCLVNSDR